MSNKPYRIEVCRICHGAGEEKVENKTKKCSPCNGTGKIAIWYSDNQWLCDYRRHNSFSNSKFTKYEI
jgi:RecJ-like exonuclease